ncbi:helix-turn-helix domain-containing protein [Peribacillus sp. B-H-3]|uniref:helix-turn-helix domain-containing protein n=1 Tax=Peribacillus sp. B-H-3 TaxID=3400420 RepID=UPI003B016EBE
MIGGKIKEFRQKKGYSLNGLANKIGISKSYLSYIERGIQKNPSIKILSKIADILETTAEDLMGDPKEQERLDPEWAALLQEAIASGASKEELSSWIEFIKFKMISNPE